MTHGKTSKSGEQRAILIPWEIWRDNFIQDAPESVARSIWEQLSEPNQVNLDKLDLKRFYSLAIPKAPSPAARTRRYRQLFSSPNVLAAWSIEPP